MIMDVKIQIITVLPHAQLILILLGQSNRHGQKDEAFIFHYLQLINVWLSVFVENHSIGQVPDLHHVFLSRGKEPGIRGDDKVIDET